MAFALVNRSAARAAIPITPLEAARLESWLAGQSGKVRAWVKAHGFTAKAHELCAIPGPDGAIARVLAGFAADEGHWAFADLPGKLPPGTYRLDPRSDPAHGAPLALGWALGSYAFTRYKKQAKDFARLEWPPGADRGAVERAARATFLVRDLVNTPAADMGPAALAEAAAALARRHRARFVVIAGDALLRRNYPLIHAVGRAAAAGRNRAARAPRLIELEWGRRTAPLVALVGKGVCFDSGGLDLKGAEAMKLMKKDMGGAAHVLGLASMIMEAGLEVRLRVLIPAVENSVSADAMRPLDVIRSRKGLTVEIGNTDAEGRLILADALAEAARGKPRLLIDVATLTGAARTALGPDLPALFCNDDVLARDLLRIAERENGPLWRLPLWRPYRELLKSEVADLSNISDSPHGGAITAALFLSEFVDPGVPWIHLDIMAWNVEDKPGRPKGGEAMGMRALEALIAERARAWGEGRGTRSRRSPRR